MQVKEAVARIPLPLVLDQVNSIVARRNTVKRHTVRGSIDPLPLVFNAASFK